MKHLGDITKISGYTAPIVDCIIGGSPCQDLSVAGKRAGLDGERSGLFMEQVRIVKEMRNRERLNGKSGVDIRPRYMVWENVPGALSSGKPKGEDFRIVLEEIAKVADKDAVIPGPPKGKWQNSGCILGDGWSIAWRILDAQFWGTPSKPLPQRRRRIALVADFGGSSASEILFVRKSVSGDSDESEPKRKEASSDASGGVGADDNVFCFEPRAAKRLGGYVWEGLAPTLRTEVGDNRPSVAYGISPYSSNAMKSSNPHSGCEGGGKGALVQEDKSATLATNNDQYLFQPVGAFCPETGGNDSSRSVAYQDGVSPTLRAGFTPAAVYSVENHPNDSNVGTGGGNVPMVMQQCFSKRKRAQSATDNESWIESNTANTLNAFDIGDVRTTEAVVYALDRASFNQGKNAQYDFEISDKGINSSLVAKGPGAVMYVDTSHADDVVRLDDTGTTLKAAGGTYGGGSENLVVACAETAVCVAVDCRNATEDTVNGTLQSGMHHSLNCNNIVRQRHIVRRLTPLECERLQGFPDNWTRIGEVVGYERQIDERTGEEYVQAIYEYIDANGKKRKTSDAARYKALGNSISIPNWKWVLKKLCACYERDATMASLFDGIGGFPYIWEQFNGKGSCLWASEIEEFPIAVTKVRFGD